MTAAASINFNQHQDHFRHRQYQQKKLVDCPTAWFEMATFSKLHLVRNSELDPVWKNMSYLNLEHNCTIFLCSLDVRNIVQGGDPLYAGFFSTQGSGGYTWPKWVRFFAKNNCLGCEPEKKNNFGEKNHFCGPGRPFLWPSELSQK